VTAVLLGAPTAVEASISIPQGVDFESWLNWLDVPGGTTLQLGTFAATLAFSAGGSGEVTPPTITNLTDRNTVGKIDLANVSPNMKLFIPAVVTSSLVFRRLRAVLDVTDGAGAKRRWLEAEVLLDRGTGF
jgi:hypothetical protein